jgi:hypothetical protein
VLLSAAGCLTWRLPDCTRTQVIAFWFAGSLANDEFLVHHGFVPPGNPYDSVLLFTSVEAALNWHLAFGPPQVSSFCIVSNGSWDHTVVPDLT